ncbi:uncharacterized protein BXZ73DRAFT_43952 [Epithele typhae]|uniref:uncharacterized protein n=1 Tax=Epithele typhae TaxID=378194 RepID=UPI002007D9A0|nr:uncharacterized protein BXZ73DRAFT_43952 [Epithele typhae]KAH9939268.1 hypothetical protein BXZ73DRAFT_43952 [Epithele typhae]
MPQVYRRHSEYSPRPSVVPRRRSTMAPPPAASSDPQPTDADDSIFLADLVRTGEASRLRRRGAMRLDHTGPRPTPEGQLRPQPPALLREPRDRRGSYVVPPSALRRSPSPERVVEEDGQDEYTYSAGPVWRDWDREPGPRPQGTGVGVLGRPDGVEVLGEGTQAFVLRCGGEEGEDQWAEVEEPPKRFRPALFPQGGAPAGPSSSASAPPRRQARRTNGCGAVVHVRAYPQHPRGAWMAKEEATDAVVALDPAYCDHPAMDKLLRSACGCIREGIGCAGCGNTLGTRYVPCQAASESIFYPHPSTSTAPLPTRPVRPFGPSYWYPRPAPHPQRRTASSAHSSRGSPTSYYTFFADRVTSSPSSDCPCIPHARTHSHPQSQATAPLPPTLAEPPRGNSPDVDYGYRWTASPGSMATPLPPPSAAEAVQATSTPAPPLSPVFALPPLPSANRSRSQLRPMSREPRLLRLSMEVQTPFGTTMDGGLDLDRDGMPVEEPSSPDKESMSWPGR